MFTLMNLRKSIRRFFTNEEGASAIEYTIIAGLISVVFIASAATVGKEINTVFTDITTKLTEAKKP